MIHRDDIVALVNSHLGRVLRAAELALSSEQFQRFRRIALDEFGRHGFGRSLARLLESQRDNNK